MSTTVLVDNLGPAVDVSEMCDKFRRFGKITSASVVPLKDKVSHGKGSICFDEPTSAFVAVREMNGQIVNGSKLSVQLSADNTAYYDKIFVKNFPIDWDDCDLLEEFSKFGEVETAEISTSDKGDSNGYGWVRFKKHSSAKNAVSTMGDAVLKGKNLIVEPFIKRGLRDTLKHTSLDYAKRDLVKSIQFNNLHVKNIPKDLAEPELFVLFEKFGIIHSVHVARHEDLSSKGFGFVCFQTKEEASKALQHMNGFSLRNKIMEVNFHQKKAARENYLHLKNSEMENVKASRFDKQRPADGNATRSHHQKLKSLDKAFHPKISSVFSYSGRGYQ